MSPNVSKPTYATVLRTVLFCFVCLFCSVYFLCIFVYFFVVGFFVVVFLFLFFVFSCIFIVFFWYKLMKSIGGKDGRRKWIVQGTETRLRQEKS